ncbi:hypothetical protein FNV43_RR08611 [Rhamnella rubrinervis]|uniref:WRKY domain-containing protein n=1 Tax=Rhamnella rubrinervis TaxID=2594499 RepID=A0A8K0MIY0_9ROSA|nr:hypothetical protein FNV43_RR08611 [Rhamnella rubrinervis]
MEVSSWPENLATSRKRVVVELMEGRELANQLQSVIAKSEATGGGSSSLSAEDLVTKIMKSFSNSLSILNVNEDDEVSVSQIPVGSRVDSACLDARKSEDSGESCRSTSTVKDRRGCYKRRRTSETWKIDSPTQIDDGHAWRKYGQKAILNASYPRNYFRCTHKYDQGCQATKQVQRIQEDPPLFRATYFGNHTCKNLLKAPELIVDCTTSPRQVPPTFISFEGTNSLSTKQDHPFFSSFTSSIKREFKEVMSCTDHMNHNQSSSSDYLMPSDDLTAFESHRPMTVLSSTMESDHGDVLSDVMDSVAFDDDVFQFEF